MLISQSEGIGGWVGLVCCLLCVVVIDRWSDVETRVVWRVWTESSLCLVSCVAKWRCLDPSHWCYLTESGRSSSSVRCVVVACQLLSVNSNDTVSSDLIVISKIRKATGPKRVENDSSPNLCLALCDLDLWPLDPKSWSFLALVP